MQISSNSPSPHSEQSDPDAASSTATTSQQIAELCKDNADLRHTLSQISHQLQQLTDLQTSASKMQSEASGSASKRQEEILQLLKIKHETEWRTAVSAARKGDYTLLAASEKAHQVARAEIPALYCDHFTAWDDEYPPWEMERLHRDGKIPSVVGTGADRHRAIEGSSHASSDGCRSFEVKSESGAAPTSHHSSADDKVGDTDFGDSSLHINISTGSAGEELRSPYTIDDLVTRFSNANVEVSELENQMRRNRDELERKGEWRDTIVGFRRAMTKQQALRRAIRDMGMQC